MPSIDFSRALALMAAMLALVPVAVPAQSAGSGNGAGQGLSVVKCNPQTNTCGEENQRTFTMPVLGPSGRATVLSPNLRTTEQVLDTSAYRVLIPGCEPVGPGAFECNSVHQYQHCRTLMFSHVVDSCLAPNPLNTGFADPRQAASGDYELDVRSNATVRVTRGSRGQGQARGEAAVVLSMAQPTDLPGAACLQRDRFLFHPTGADGGASEIDDTASCDEPIKFSFAPHEDDIIRAYDVCEGLVAWGSEIEDSMEVIAAGLFHMRSNDPAFAARHKSGVGIIAPYVTAAAPLTIDCVD